MIKALKNWYEKHFSDPQTVMLLFTLIVVFSVILVMGDMLIPVIASIVIAYLLEGMVLKLEGFHVARILAVMAVFACFILFVMAVIFILLPLLYNQIKELFDELPVMMSQVQASLMKLPKEYPNFFTEVQIADFMNSLKLEVGGMGKSVITWSLSSVVGVITVLVYLILVPLLVFFFMKDKQTILDWVGSYMPGDRGLASVVWTDVDRQIGNYVRGKFIEILIIWAVCLVTFAWFDLNFAMLLAVLVGLSVIVPYIGAAVVTLPVALVAYFQWGLTGDFYWVMGAYLVIQALDGNALVPLLFSEVVNLHPIAIIVAILVFGGLWGFWGVFFAIPLATLVQAILKAWPQAKAQEAPA